MTYLVARAADRWDGDAPVRSSIDELAAELDAAAWKRSISACSISTGSIAPGRRGDAVAADRRVAVRERAHRAGAGADAVGLERDRVGDISGAASAFGNNLTSVVLAAIVGTFFMISTWSEIPMALQLIQSGFNGPAAALLVVLPAISLPCMMLLGGSLQRFRIVALLSSGVMIVGIAAGALFL